MAPAPLPRYIGHDLLKRIEKGEIHMHPRSGWIKLVLLMCVSVGLSVGNVGGQFFLLAQAEGNPDTLLSDLDANLPGATPRLFAPGKVTTPLTDWGITMCPHGDEIFYTISAGHGKSVIVALEWENGKWSDPTPLPFSGQYWDGAPTMSGDGSRLVFCSNRPVFAGDTSTDINLWCVERFSGDWDKPYPLNAVNTDDDELFPSLARSGDLFFCSRRGGKNQPSRIFMAEFQRGEFLKPKPLAGELPTAQGEYCPSITPDGTCLFVEIPNAPGGFGGGDLYVSRRQADGSWGKAVNLGARINSAKDDCYPMVTRGGGYLVFMSTRPAVGQSIPMPPSLQALFGDASSAHSKEPFDFYWVSLESLAPLLK
jgi:hypothetical protein